MHANRKQLIFPSAFSVIGAGTQPLLHFPEVAEEDLRYGHVIFSSLASKKLVS